MAHKIFSETYYFSSDVLKHFLDRDNEKLADDFASFTTQERVSHSDLVRFVKRWYTDSSVMNAVFDLECNVVGHIDELLIP
jgi:hypothetical protein